VPDTTDAVRKLKSKCGFEISASKDGLAAYLSLNRAELEHVQLSGDDIVAALKDAGIVYGHLNEVIQKILDEQSGEEPDLVARGDPPEHGKDAELEFMFSTSQRKSPKEDSDGRIDYKELDYIQNASAGEVLIRKTPATKGVSGKSVFGKEISAKPGKDMVIIAGSNTTVSPDGLQLTADIDGSLVYSNSRTSVHQVQTISGSVDSSTGNIKCNGSLKITKEVKSGFKVRVKGDLEINGHVEDAEITCEGNVIVKGGFFGGGSGKIVAGGNVTVKWVESQTIHSDGTISIGGEAINAKLYGKDGILVMGSRGMIAGGEATSRYLITAPVLGSDAGAKTHLKVAFDAVLMKQLKSIEAERNRLNEDVSRVKDGLTALYKMQMSGKLSSDKEAVLKELENFKKDAPAKIQELEKERSAVLEKLREIENAEIIAEEKVYTGAVVHFGTLYKEIMDERGPTRFHVDYDSIMASNYKKHTK
jgi:uncharacterized protein (DUF342 family)